MATPRPSDVATQSKALADELSQVLPKGAKFTAHHLSTPPTTTDSLCLPPACPPTTTTTTTGTSEPRPVKPLKTYCEKHFLAISIDASPEPESEPLSRQRILALALEIYIYTTTFSTTIFVAKADSTGYLSLLRLPKGTPSPTREITAAFVAFLVAHRRRKGKQCVVNLFARAQSQYLFPGSASNKDKHVLDDRGLVRWWCRVLDPLLEADEPRRAWERVHGYLIIPGLDEHETRAFLPPPQSSTAAPKWTLGHPLEHISPYARAPSTYGPDVPPRCLIPMYPDDPKARFVLELEEATSQRRKLARGWTSPRTLADFWEMMAFRQECAAGRMTGFVWIVFDPPGEAAKSEGQGKASVAESTPTQNASSGVHDDPSSRLRTPEPNQAAPSVSTPQSTQSSPDKKRPPRPPKPAKKDLKGVIIPRQPRIKTHQRARFPDRVETPHFCWPEAGRGEVVLDEAGYNKAVELLLHLEFGTLEAAVTSTERWVNEVNVGEPWGWEVVGVREAPVCSATTKSAAGQGMDGANDLSGVVRRKRSVADALGGKEAAGAGAEAKDEGVAVNMLGGGLLRKKTKTTTAAETEKETGAETAGREGTKVNTLGTGLVRKKPKGG